MVCESSLLREFFGYNSQKLKENTNNPTSTTEAASAEPTDKNTKEKTETSEIIINKNLEPDAAINVLIKKSANPEKETETQSDEQNPETTASTNPAQAQTNSTNSNELEQSVNLNQRKSISNGSKPKNVAVVSVANLMNNNNNNNNSSSDSNNKPNPNQRISDKLNNNSNTISANNEQKITKNEPQIQQQPLNYQHSNKMQQYGNSFQPLHLHTFQTVSNMVISSPPCASPTQNGNSIAAIANPNANTNTNASSLNNSRSNSPWMMMPPPSQPIQHYPNNYNNANIPSQAPSNQFYNTYYNYQNHHHPHQNNRSNVKSAKNNFNHPDEVIYSFFCKVFKISSKNALSFYFVFIFIKSN